MTSASSTHLSFTTLQNNLKFLQYVSFNCISIIHKDAELSLEGYWGYFSTPEFGVLEQWTEIEIDSLLQSAPSDLKT